MPFDSQILNKPYEMPALDHAANAAGALDHAAPAGTEIAGLDIYDPISDEVKSRDVHDIAYWMLDDDYDGSNFVVKQLFFCGGAKDEFDKWRKGLDSLAKDTARQRTEATLRIQLNEDAFSRLYGHTSHPFPTPSSRKIAARVISQFGKETTKVLEIGDKLANK